MYKSSETNTTYIEMLPGNIFLVSLKPNSVIDLEEAKAWIRTTNSLLDTDSMLRAGMYDISLISKVTPEAQDYLRSGQDVIGTVVGVAIISSSAMGRMVGNMFLELGPARVFPIKFFDSPIRGEHWIRNLLCEAGQQS